jgi:hypothetical protein
MDPATKKLTVVDAGWIRNVVRDPIEDDLDEIYVIWERLSATPYPSFSDECRLELLLDRVQRQFV